MEFHTIPFLNVLIEKIEKRLFLKHFQNSHNKYLEHVYQTNWIPCENYNFSYKFHLENIHKNNLNDISYFMIKNNSSINIKNIKINIHAESIFCKYIQNISIDELMVNDKPLRIYLHQIPFQELEYYKEHILKKYDVFSMDLISIENKKIDQTIYKVYPTYTTFLNDKWVTKWNSNWNLQNIERGKNHLSDYIYSKIAGTNISDIMIFQIDYHPRRFIKFLLYKMLTNKISITILFWIFIWTGKITEDENGILIYK